jgi:two-component system sensor histidine kinase AlgZ
MTTSSEQVSAGAVSREADLIPREMLWLYPVAPLAAAPVLLHGLFEHSLSTALSLVASLYVPFLSFSLVCHALYLGVLPRVMRGVRSPLGRWAVHLGVIIGVPLVFSPLVQWLDLHLCPHPLGLSQYTLVNMVITALFIVPAVLVQDLRNRKSVAEREAVEAKQASLRAQLEALQARTNPHFFFNAINTVASLIPEDPTLAEHTLEKLADLFRYTLDSARTPSVPLSRELEVVRDYLAIQEARYGDRLRTTLEVSPAVEGVQVPPLVLQPLVENAILHGMASRSLGAVAIQVTQVGARVCIEVRDDGPGPGGSAHQGNQTSVRDLRARLRLAYGERASFTLDDAPGGGGLARLLLPMEG